MSNPLAKLSPGREEPSPDPWVMDVTGESADRTFETLGAETTRRVYAALCREPATPSELAERLDTSLQNLSYHLDKLEEADLIVDSGVRYSSRGREMTVYAPRHDPLVVAGDADARRSLADAVPRVLGSVAVVAGLGLLAQWALRTTTLAGPADSVGPAGLGASGGAVPFLLQPAVLAFLAALLAAVLVVAFD